MYCFQRETQRVCVCVRDACFRHMHSCLKQYITERLCYNQTLKNIMEPENHLFEQNKTLRTLMYSLFETRHRRTTLLLVKPWEINMEPEDHLFEEDNHLPTLPNLHFWFQNVNFPQCTHLVHQLYIIHPSAPQQKWVDPLSEATLVSPTNQPPPQGQPRPHGRSRFEQSWDSGHGRGKRAEGG